MEAKVKTEAKRSLPKQIRWSRFDKYCVDVAWGTLRDSATRDSAAEAAELEWGGMEGEGGGAGSMFQPPDRARLIGSIGLW